MLTSALKRAFAEASALERENRRFVRQVVEWQRGYGVVSFSKRHLDTVVEYVRNQKKHHGEGTTIDMLENGGDA